jgi:hypothetical protein
MFNLCSLLAIPLHVQVRKIECPPVELTAGLSVSSNETRLGMHFTQPQRTEPVFLNVYGAKESIPRNEFRQPMYPGGPV